MKDTTAHEPRPRRAPRAALHLSLLAGTLVVEGITLASGNAASPYPLLYFLIVTAIDGFDSLPTAEREFLLVAAGRTAAAAKRDVDSAARLGDDELAIIATYTDERGAGVLAERICDQARELGRVTLSAGVVSYPRHGATAERLLGAARDARAAAAELGGDRGLVAASAADSGAARRARAGV